MNVCLVGNIFGSEGAGIGNYSQWVFESLKTFPNLNISTVSIKDSNINSIIRNQFLHQFIYNNIEIPFLLPESDIYHALYPAASARLNKKKSVVTVHDLNILKPNFKFFNSSLMNRALKFSFNQSMKYAIKSKIITISEETKYDINKFYQVNLENITVIRIPIGLNLFPMDKKENTYNIGVLGRLAKDKRVDILIKSFLKANILNSNLLIGGTGPEEEKLKKIAKNDERIKFLGFIPNEKVNDFYNSLDVFVFPTQTEGYGLPIVEAMMCAKPVVTLDDANIPFDIKNRTHISSIQNLANDLKNKNFKCDIDSNLNFAKKEHSIKKFGKKMVEVYESI